MQFEVRVPDASDHKRIRLVVVEARDWFSALREALQEIGENTQLRNVLCDLVEDGVYRVTESDSGRIFQIQESAASASPTDAPTTRMSPGEAPAPSPAPSPAPANDRTEVSLPPFSVEAITQPKQEKHAKPLAATMQMDFAAIIQAQGGAGAADATVDFTDFASKQDIELGRPSVIVSEEAYGVTPPSDGKGRDRAMTIEGDPNDFVNQVTNHHSQKKDEISEITGAVGKYQPGMTDELLANVFMRAMDVHDYPDVSSAMDFVIDLALGDVKALGGGVMLTDLNSAEQVLWFEAVRGPNADLIRNFRIPLGQGIVGYYTQQGVNQTVPDVRKDPRYAEDMLKGSGLDLGPLLCAPIANNGRVWGCILLYNDTSARAFTQGELSIMTYLAHVTGEYMSNQN